MPEARFEPAIPVLKRSNSVRGHYSQHIYSISVYDSQ
jgi:hypothetical protein